MAKKDKVKKPKEKQLNLGLKQSPLNIFRKYRDEISSLKARLDIRKYSKSTWVWFCIILSTSFIITQIYSVQQSLTTLPERIPLYQIYVDNTQRLSDTDFIYLIPGLSLIILLTGIGISNRMYNKERNLSNVLLLTMLISIATMSIALIRLINLY